MAPRLGPTTVETLDNGLRVLLRSLPGSSVVTSALIYRTGTRDEAPGQGGAAHFLEHMMFKGSTRFGPGEIDRRTQALGGSNNAFTSHDVTAYHFSFAADRWREALVLEADRRARPAARSRRGGERAPGDPGRDRDVRRRAVGRPRDGGVRALLRRTSLRPAGARSARGSAGDGRRRAARFPPRALPTRPRRAGGLDETALDDVRSAFGEFAPSGEGRPRPEPPARPTALDRFERRHGEVARGLWALPAPAADHGDHAALRVVSSLLAGGRASRLHRILVEEKELALSISADVHETEAPGVFTLGVELMPDGEPQAVEAILLEELARLRSEAPRADELERARRILLADWVFGHEKVHQQALAIGCRARCSGKTTPTVNWSASRP